MKKILIVLGVSLLSGFFLLHDTTVLSIKKIQNIRRISLPLPQDNIVSLNRYEFIEQGDTSYLIAYFYPVMKLYVYNITSRKITKEIPLYKNLAGVNTFHYIAPDSIWIFGYSSLHYNYDSSLMVINEQGTIKHIFPLYHPYFVTLKTYPDLYADVNALDENGLDTVLFVNNLMNSENFIFDNKIFFSTTPANIGKHPLTKQLPIVGYYDLKQKKVVLNNNISYPFHDKKRFYPTTPYFYYSVYLSKSHRNTILLSFPYTKTIIEWDYKTGKIFYHNQLKSLLIDTIYSYREPLITRPDSLHYWGKIIYKKQLNKYVRYALLSQRNQNAMIYIFADTNLNYLGEAFIPKGYGITTFKSKFVTPYIAGGHLSIRYYEYLFGNINPDRLFRQKDSLLQAYQLFHEKVCKIVGKKSPASYKAEYLFNYLRNRYMVKDSSFVLVVVNRNGCHTCNERILKNLGLNQKAFEKNPKPVYLLYVAESIPREHVVKYLKGYGFRINRHILIDTTALYNEVHPFSSVNPRAVFVENGKVLSDTVYMPQKLDLLYDRFINFYHLVKN